MAAQDTDLFDRADREYDRAPEPYAFVASFGESFAGALGDDLALLLLLDDQLTRPSWAS